MFKYLQETDSEFGKYWCTKHYQETIVPTLVSTRGEEMFRLLRPDPENPNNQLLHDALIKNVRVEYNNPNIQNDARIAIEFRTSDSRLLVVYHEVYEFKFGQCGTFSPIPDIDVHEVSVDEEWLVHQILCHGAEDLILIKAKSIDVSIS